MVENDDREWKINEVLFVNVSGRFGGEIVSASRNCRKSNLSVNGNKS